MLSAQCLRIAQKAPRRAVFRTQFDSPVVNFSLFLRLDSMDAGVNNRYHIDVRKLKEDKDYKKRCSNCNERGSN